MVFGLLLFFIATLPRPAVASAASDSLSSRVMALKGEGRYAEAAALVDSILALERNEHGVRPFELRGSEAWARALRVAADLPTSERAVLAASEALFGSLVRHFRVGESREAAEIAEELVHIQRRLLGSDHYDVAETLSGLGLARMSLGQYARADSALEEALRIKIVVFGERHPHVAHALDNVSVNAGRWGNTEEAIHRAEEALELYRSLLGPDAPQLARSLNSLAVLHRTRGDYVSAASFARESIRVAGSGMRPDSTQLGVSLHTLALIRGAQGDYAAAEPLFQEALELRRKLRGADHPDVGRSLSSLASLEIERGNLDRADSLSRIVLGMRHERFGDRHPETLATRHRLGEIAIEAGALAEGRRALEAVLADRRSMLGAGHPDVIETQRALARASLRAGSATEARRAFSDVIASNGPRADARSSADLRGLAEAHLLLGETQVAIRLLEEAAAVFEASHLRVDEGFTRVAFETSPYPLLALARHRAGDPVGAWEAAERGQGRLLAGQREDSSALAGPEATSLTALDRAVRQLEAEHLAIQGEVARKGTATDSALLETEADVRSRLLRGHADLAALRRELAARHGTETFVGIDALQSLLPPRAALVGWVDAPLGSGHETLVYVVRAAGPIAWRRISGEATTASPSLAERVRRALEAPLRSLVSLGAARVDPVLREAGHLLLDPMEDLLAGAEDLIVLPNAAFGGIPLEALMDADGRYLGSRFSVTYVPSATLHAKLAAGVKEKGVAPLDRALWVADPPFRPDDLVASPAPAALTGGSSAMLSAQRGLLAGALSGNENALRALPRLPWTREESNTAAKCFASSDRLLGREATEARLAQMARDDELSRYGVIHFGTHALVDAEDPQRSSLILSLVDSQTPAGGEILPTDTDGMLTAGEIMREWKLEADLVTMSACETGLGRRLTGEGYVGLAHAFLQAGAASVLASLWQVDDRATALFMQRFYEIWTSNDRRAPRSITKADALRETRAWLATYEDESGAHPYAHPGYWAAFVLIGGSD